MGPPRQGGYETFGQPVVVSRAMQVKTVNARTQGEDRRQQSGANLWTSLKTGSPVVICYVQMAKVQSGSYSKGNILVTGTYWTTSCNGNLVEKGLIGAPGDARAAEEYHVVGN